MYICRYVYIIHRCYYNTYHIILYYSMLYSIVYHNYRCIPIIIFLSGRTLPKVPAARGRRMCLLSWRGRCTPDLPTTIIPATIR